MTNQTPNSKIAETLEQMAESYYPEHEYNYMWRVRNAELVAVAATQLQQLIVEARLNEAFLIGIKQEKGEYLPASYLIDRKAELQAQLNKDVGDTDE